MSTLFLHALKSSRVKRIALGELRRFWLDANPEQLQYPERDVLLLTALRELEAQGALALPARGSFERIGSPPMPKFVTIVSQSEARPSNDWSCVSWLPELGFWTELTTSELVTAKAINSWLIHRRGKFLRVPLRERSLEIFGDEKYLDLRVRDNALFSRRLPLGMIGAFIVPHPLPYRAAEAPGRPVLVVENHHTYWSLAEWNMQVRRYAAVVYGAGTAFYASGQALHEVLRECRGTGAEYFGDVDPTGILIPFQSNYPGEFRIRPAINLYRIVLDCGYRRCGVKRMAGDERAAEQWLPALSHELCALWASGQWIPQESLGTEQLFSNWEAHINLAVPKALECG